MNSSPQSVFHRPSKEQRRVAITGIGLLSPLGLSAKENWENVCNGASGIAPISLFDTSSFDVKIAGEVKNFDPDAYIAKKEQKKMDRFIHLAFAASEMAIVDSGIAWSDELRENTGVFIGVGIGGLPLIEKQHEILTQRGPGRVTPFFIPGVISNLASGQISIAHQLKGPNYSVTSACASGSHAIGEAARYIRDGLCSMMIAGGSESAVSPMAIAGFNSMKALSTNNQAPAEASRPWDKDRDGFVLAEGAGVVVLEDMELAMSRGAKIYGELSGYGASSDGYHMTSPPTNGQGAAKAMAFALKDASLTPDSIGYINAHGTSTPVGDQIEVTAIKRVFGAHAKKLAMSSTKSMTGHALGAAGAIESIFSLLSLSTSILPPTINLENPSDDCDLDFIPAVAREVSVKHVLNNSFGFGGTNASLIFSKVDS